MKTTTSRAAALALLLLARGARAAEPGADEAADESEEEGPRPDKTSGVLSGQVSGEGGEEVADAQVVVVGTKLRASADFEGKWAIKLPPGSYTLRIFYPGFKAQRVENVVVKRGERSRIDVRLEADKKVARVDVVEVEVEPDRSKAAAQLLVRRKLAGASDAVSAQDMAKSPDRNAAEAARRVVGVTVQQNRFVYVRGLGDRYTNSMLNGSPLPSPEPDVQAIPLDIFPVGVLANLTVLKTYTPDLPADFTGGSVRLNTRQIPSKFVLSVSGVVGFNSQTSLRERDTYRGGSLDWMGQDDGSRKLPSAVGAARVDNRDKAANAEKARAMPQQGRSLFSTLSPPHHTLSFVAGNRHEVAGKPLGWLLSGSFGRRFERRDERQALYYLDGGGLTPDFSFSGRRSTETTTLSTLGSVTYQLAPGHKLAATGLATRRADDEALSLRGFEDERKSEQALSTARWVERTLLFGQLSGEHRAGEGELRWQGFLGQARRAEPNFVQTVYEQRDDLPFSARLDDGTTHFFSSQRERVHGGSLDLEQPLDPRKTVKLKGGVFGQWKGRTFGARRFRYQQIRGPGCADLLLSPVQRVLAPESMGTCLFLDESTAPTDSYTADQRVLAGYLMADLNPTRWLRLVVGTRVEAGSLELVSRDPFSSGAPPIQGGYDHTDALPSASAVVSLSGRSNLRLAATRTVARPQLREVSPFGFQDFFNAVRVSGNPALDRSKITNLDARFEHFPTPDEVVAFSVFYKRFDRPIEATFLPASDPTRTFTNARSARNLGAEVEARRSLGFVSQALRHFSLVGNVSLVHSRVSLDDRSKTLEGGEERPLQGQAPWVVNAALDWQSASEATRARASYNVLGSRIDTVGFAQLPDVFERPRHVVDLSFAQAVGRHLDVKVAVENLLDAPFVFEQGGRETARWKVGTTGWLTLTAATER
jgi:hypothetical protein